MLRTRFVELDGEARQAVEALPSFALIEEVACNEEELRRLRHREKSICFNLCGDLLFRFCLIELIGEGGEPGGNTHVLHITLHHIIADGQSVAVLLKELAHFYNHDADDAPMAPLPFQYGDYVAWQGDAVRMEQLETQTGYWRAKLDGLPSSLELPLDFARPREQTYSGAKQKLAIGRETCVRLRELSRQHGATLFMTLISAFGVLLGRHSRQHDFAIGTPISKRELPGTEQLIGLFLNMLVLRFDLNPEQSFASLLRDIKNTAVDAYRHQDVPFENLVEQLKPERSLSHTPFFQVSVSLVENPLEDISFRGLTPTLLDMEESEGVARYDLTFMLRILPDGGVMGTMEYNTDLFAAQTIERMLAHYRRLLEAIADAPGKALYELDLLSDEERQRQMADGVRALRAYPKASVHALFEAQARRQPDAIAVADGVTQLSYGELERCANRVAHCLIAHGVAVDTCVGLCAERSVDMAVVLLGILKAGAAYVPLDPRYPELRLKQMIDASGSRLILCDRRLQGELGFLAGYPTIALGRGGLDAQLGDYPDTAPSVSVSPDNLAYVIFTSGSTGVPKGIAISHKSIARLVFNDFVPFEGLDTYLCAASLSFDAFTFEFWAPLLHGKKSVLFEFKENSLESFGLMMRSHRVDCAWLTAALFNQVIVNAPQALGGLKFLLAGGEALSKEHIHVARNTLPEVNLVNGYGPTENTTFSCTYLIAERDTGSLVSIPIGTPIDNSEAFVLDDRGGLLPTRCVGELYVGGDGLARAYVNRPALTAEKFVPHPYGKTPGARLYRTGDLVRRREDGNIEYIGRADDQIKVRGFRIELGEIEQALKEHADVDQGLVVAREDRPGERRLVAYVVSRRGADEDLAADLARHLKGRVPDYAVPGAFVMLAAFPLNANGKIDRPRLPVPDESDYARAQYVAPRTALEERLAALWRANLGWDGSTAIGVHDNYFAIGGDSIRSISLVSSARADGLHFAIKDLFAHPTVAELATVVEETDADTGLPVAIAPFALLSANEKARLPARHHGRTVVDAYPLSMLQQGMWFHSLQNPDLSLYIDVVTYRLRLKWDPSCFETCLRYLTARHAVLRTVFVKQGGQILQLVTEESHSIHRCIDSRGTPSDERDAVVRDWVETEKRRGIASLDNLWRMTVHQFDAETIQLTLVLHHAILDGWSVAALYAELTRLYALVQGGKELPAIACPPGHQHVVDLENRALAEGAPYWKEKLERARLPWWTGATKTPSIRVFCDVSNDDARGIEALARRLKVNDRSIWCAAYLALIATLNGSRDVVGVTVTHGRPEIRGAENTLGLFLNTLPVRVRLHGATWEKLITDTNDELERVYAHRHYPLAKIQLETGLDFSASLFNYTNFHVENHIAASTDRGFDENNSLLAFNVRKDESSRRHYCALNLEPSVFDAEFVRRIQAYVKNILTLLRVAPERQVEFGSILQPAEVRNQLALWNPRRSLPDEESNVAKLIDEQVARTPDAVAVTFDDRHYSYRFLGQAANGIAANLESRGLTSRSLVGIAMERSFDMLAAVLACLKSGICYVPLDPNLPPSRIAYIVEDAAIDLMIGEPAAASVESPRWKTMSGAQLTESMLSGAARTSARRVHPAHLAYIIYTSGSTGKPKGVGVSHGNLVNFVKCIREQPGLNRNDRLFAVTTLSFDIAFLELIVPLAEGAMIDIARADDVYDGKKIIHRLATRKISCMQATPSTWKLMLDAGWNGSPGLKGLVGGEALPADLAGKLIGRVDQLWNMYGPTETTIWSTTRRIRDARVDIGHPLRNTSVYVLNETLDLLPTGVVGELYIGGAGLARGYENRPGLTAERFVPNPFAGDADPGSRIYRTGDLVRYLAGGDIEYMGRADQQIKVRGYRVELGEIEEAIRQTGLVKDALAVLRSDDPANPAIVAYIVPLTAGLPENAPAAEVARGGPVRQLREKLRQFLPVYMLPSAFVAMDAFPLTPNGKLDRKALPLPADALRTSSLVAPEGVFETRIAAIWAEVLKREGIGRHDNFFELGGHSLLIMQLSARIDEAFDIAVALKDFYEYPQLSEIASRIEFLGTIQTMDEELIEGMSDDEAMQLLYELEKVDSLSAPIPGIADQP
jgi:amino acid adenylation domain-containing protein